jgi:hypothetical protein
VEGDTVVIGDSLAGKTSVTHLFVIGVVSLLDDLGFFVRIDRTIFAVVRAMRLVILGPDPGKSNVVVQQVRRTVFNTRL